MFFASNDCGTSRHQPKMKQFVVIFAILAVTLADWTPKSPGQLATDRDECYVSEKIPSSSQEMITKGLFPSEPGCYYRCSGLKAEIWDDVNGYNNDRGYDLLQTDGWDATIESLKKCNTPDKKDADPCKWSVNVAKCLWDNDLIKKKV